MVETVSKQHASHEMQVFASNGTAYTVSLADSWEIVSSRIYVIVMALFSLLVALFDAPVFDVDLPFVARFIYWFVDCYLATGFWFVQARIMMWLIDDLKLPLLNIGALYTFFDILVMVWIDYWFSVSVLGMAPLTGWQVWGAVFRYTGVGIVIELLVVSFIMPRFDAINPISWRTALSPSAEFITVNDRTVQLDELRYIKSIEHYVELVTDSGTLLERATLKELIDQVGLLDGIQPHRSYWVARRAVSELKRSGDNMVLLLSCGIEIPVSRGRRKAVEAWLEEVA